MHFTVGVVFGKCRGSNKINVVKNVTRLVDISLQVKISNKKKNFKNRGGPSDTRDVFP